MLSDSTPSVSVRSKAVRSTRSRLKGTRRWVMGLEGVATLACVPVLQSLEPVDKPSLHCYGNAVTLTP